MTEPRNEPHDQQPEPKPAGRVSSDSAWRIYTMVFALIAIWLIFAYTTGGSFPRGAQLFKPDAPGDESPACWQSHADVIVTGHIDLSIGSAVGLAGVWRRLRMRGRAGVGPSSRPASRWAW